VSVSSPLSRHLSDRSLEERLSARPTGAMLFGRRTYEDFFSVWPHRTCNPFTEFLNNIPKYFASTTPIEPLP
jgi:hypothetical protein